MVMPPIRPIPSGPKLSAGIKAVATKKVATKSAPVNWEEQYAAGRPSRSVPGGKTTLGSLVGQEYSRGVNAKSEETDGFVTGKKKPVIIPSLAMNLAKIDRSRSTQFKK
jgi:hypothetical protein